MLDSKTVALIPRIMHIERVLSIAVMSRDARDL
jgi:hypothetical protein